MQSIAKTESAGPVAGTGSRIPKTLQAVFLASNRGNDVHKPPPKQVAFRTFFRRIMGGKNPSEEKLKTNTTKKLTNSKVGEVGEDKNIASKIEASFQKKTSSSSKPPLPKKIEDPQVYLDTHMRQRGYNTKRYNTLKTAYHNKPTELQRASYDLHLIGIVKSSQPESLDEILKAGISPNPCNTYGESLVHMVCRRGDQKLLQVMIQNGCDIQVADDYGRTPLHDACWAADPAFETVEMICEKDVTLFQMTDCRGFLPLTYVRKDHWPEWIKFLEQKMDTYWPNLLINDLHVVEPSIHSIASTVCEFVDQDPNTRPIADPRNALPLDLANKVASGAIKPEEAVYLRNQRMARNNDEDDDDDDEEDDDDEDDDDDEYDDDDDEDDFTDDEMDELIGALTVQLGGRVLEPITIPTSEAQ